jgi:hypothetical protein
MTKVSESWNYLFLGTSICILEDNTLTFDLVKDRYYHLTQFFENYVLVMFNDMIQKVVEFNVLESILNYVSQPRLEEFFQIIDMFLSFVIYSLHFLEHFDLFVLYFEKLIESVEPNHVNSVFVKVFCWVFAADLHDLPHNVVEVYDLRNFEIVNY